MSGSIAYMPGRPAVNPGPLARFLPPVPDRIAATWLRGHLPSGAWVLDPFGASPRLAVEAARAGYRVLVAANNPVARFLLEMTARPPAESELRAALADLAAAHKGAERLEPHIRSLYLTECAQCRQEIMAEAYVWDRDASAPSGRIYRCPHCGDAGEHPASKADMARAAQFEAGGLHRARALERVAPLDDPDRPHVEEALSVYLPRAVYALFTLINKLESFPPPRRALLSALLLSACDQANTLWPHPTARARPRQLTIPPHFREYNVWLALEEAIEQWATGLAALPLSSWPIQPPGTGGISVFEGRLKDLGGAGNLSEIKIEAVLAALPRPNQAYWTLSALWAGWLWGREAAAPFKSVLRRRRYDWAWHSTALNAALNNLVPLLEPATPFIGLIGEAEPGFLSAAILAAGMAGFDCSGLALRAENGQAQITWQRTADEQILEIDPAADASGASFTGVVQEIGQSAGRAYLYERAEPCDYLNLHSAALFALSQSPARAGYHQSPADTIGQVQAAFLQAFTYRGGFIRYGGSEHSLEVGRWWLRDDPASHKREAGKKGDKLSAPLADRVEMALVRYLQKNQGCTFEDVDIALCSHFTGLLTPDPRLIQASLDSYGEQQPDGSGRWQLRAQDSPKARRADLATMNRLLNQIGQRLGYEVTGQAPLIWKEPGGEIAYVFFLIASAVFGDIILTTSHPPSQSVIICPGGRASLVAHKLERDARLAQAVGDGWRFVKFRHVHRLAENTRLSRENIDEQLSYDPLTSSEPQIPLL